MRRNFFGPSQEWLDAAARIQDLEFIYHYSPKPAGSFEVDSERGPFCVVKWFKDGREEPIVGVDGKRVSFDWYPDAWAEAMRLNREIGVTVRLVGYFDLWQREERKREREEIARAEAQRKREQEEAERKRKLEADAAAGSPGRLSPECVSVDPAYEKVGSFDGNSYPSTTLYVVRHLATGNFWACRFRVREDDSDFGCETGWHQVEARTVTRVVYEPKKS